MINYGDCEEFMKRADDEVEALAQKSWNCMVCVGNAFDICEKLTQHMKRMNQECDAYLLGEITMGISNENTKLQIFLDLDRKSYYTPRDYKENVNDLKLVRNLLSRDPNWRILRMNYHLPSLNICYRPTNEICELSVTNGLSVQLSGMIGHFFTIQPEAIKFYHFVRLWLKINQVRFKTFNIVLIVIHYLQTHNYMPSAYRAQRNLELNLIEGCATSFDNSKTLSDYGVKKLHYYYSIARGFFRYYWNFKYESCVISTFYGYAMRKCDHPKLDYDSPMCLPAFINQQSNSSHRISASELSHFVSICKSTYEYLDFSY